MVVFDLHTYHSFTTNENLMALCICVLNALTSIVKIGSNSSYSTLTNFTAFLAISLDSATTPQMTSPKDVT